MFGEFSDGPRTLANVTYALPMPMARAPIPTFKKANPGLPAAASACPGARTTPESARNETRARTNRRMEISSEWVIGPRPRS